MPRYQGIVAQDCVKVLIDEDNDDGTSKKSVYFGKCVAFLQDSEGKQFVVLRWFTRHEDNGFDMISKVPSFKLAPDGHTNSFSTLPLDAILNGAIMVPGGGSILGVVISTGTNAVYQAFSMSSSSFNTT